MNTEFYYGSAVPDEIFESMIGITAAAVILLIFLFFIIIPLVVISIIGICKVFKKAGRPAGFAFIPFYGTYVSYDIAGCKNLFWGYLAVMIVSTLISGITPSTRDGTMVMLVITQLCSIASLVFGIIWSVKLAKAFGKSGGFAVGLIFLAPIFMMILGCDKSQYQGKIPVRASDQAKQTASQTWKCPDCGAYNLAENNFCFHCGRSKQSNRFIE